MKIDKDRYELITNIRLIPCISDLFYFESQYENN